MIYRISSMYSHNKKVMITVIVAFIAEVTINITIYCLAARVAADALKALPVVTGKYTFRRTAPNTLISSCPCKMCRCCQT